MKTFLPFRAPPPGMLVLALTIFASSAPAQAQLRLPGLNLPLPQRLGPLDLQVVRDPAERLLAATPLPELGKLRLREVDSLLQRHGNLLEQDPRGEPAVRSEILAWSPSAAGREAALAAGLTIIRERQLDGLDEIMVVFAVPAALRTADVLARLRILDPEGSYDFNHVYAGSSVAPMAVRAPATSGSGPVRSPGRLPAVGLVDSGVDQAHPVFADATVTPWGCDGARHPHHHGTAVAGLMVGMSAHFRGVRPGASLFAADVYCNSGTGGSADKIAAALAWLAREQVGVINLSIVGPANQTLEKVVAAMVRRGHLLVAAVGNDGPAAAPLYPASYPGVVGVSAVDRRGRVLPEAARGAQVKFAAPGNQMVSASPGSPPYRPVRGTSFAAPIVAAMLSGLLPRPDVDGAARALASLAKMANKGDGIEAEVGLGVVGREFRIDPAELR